VRDGKAVLGIGHFAMLAANYELLDFVHYGYSLATVIACVAPRPVPPILNIAKVRDE
jgi:hypothetical protein